MDWGLFYTCPQFYPQWRNYQKLLAQRNAALKENVSRETLSSWSVALAEAGEALDRLRAAYLEDFLPIFYEITAVFIPTVKITTDYAQGWEGATLLTCLTQQLFLEPQTGHTLFGPHRADLVLTVDNLSITDVLSQGQQKLVSYALRLAQGIHLKTTTEKTPAFLIDDLPSELDNQKQRLVTQILEKLNAQVFVTGIHQDELERMI